MARKRSFPFRDAEFIIKALFNQVSALIMGRRPPKWTGPKLAEPVHVVAMQPADRLENMKSLEMDEALSDLIWLAFQFGCCQGYHLAEQEHKKHDELVAQSRRLAR